MKKASATQTEYWEKKLTYYGLGLDRGCSDWLDYGHKVLDLDFDGRIAYRPTTGESLEHEWPQSLC